MSAAAFAADFGWLWFLLAGAAVGSFLNALVHRLPQMEAGAADVNLFWPGSRCPRCRAPIPPRRNIPILSWLWLRGRAPCCGERISPRYLILEALCAALFVAFWLRAAPLPWPQVLLGCGGLAAAAALLGWVMDDAPAPASAVWSLLWLGLLDAALNGSAAPATWAAAVGAAIWLAAFGWHGERVADDRSWSRLGALLMAPGAWFGWVGLTLAAAAALLALSPGGGRRATLLVSVGLMLMLSLGVTR